MPPGMSQQGLQPSLQKARLQKLIAAAGICSRRHAEELLQQGRVQVNGRTAQLGDRADPDTDDIRLDGVRIGESPIIRRRVVVDSRRRSSGAAWSSASITSSSSASRSGRPSSAGERST